MPFRGYYLGTPRFRQFGNTRGLTPSCRSPRCRGKCPPAGRALAALLDLCRSLHPFSVMDSGRIGGIEDLCCTVHFPSVANQCTKRLAAFADSCCSLDPFDVMESRQIGGIEGLRSTVRFLSIPDEFRDFPSP